MQVCKIINSYILCEKASSVIHENMIIQRSPETLTKRLWVWIAKGPGIAPLKFPVLLTLAKAKFRQFLLDSCHNLSIANAFLKPASKIQMEVVSRVPKQAAQIRESLASFPQWNWERKEAGSDDRSRKHPSSRQSRAEARATASTLQRLLLKAGDSGPGGNALPWPAIEVLGIPPILLSWRKYLPPPTVSFIFQHTVMCRN